MLGEEIFICMTCVAKNKYECQNVSEVKQVLVLFVSDVEKQKCQEKKMYIQQTNGVEKKKLFKKCMNCSFRNVSELEEKYECQSQWGREMVTLD